MDSKNKEAAGAITWLLCAGGAALALSAFLFWADDTVMGGAQARDKAFAEQMKELRVAQSSLPSRVTDDRQKLPLVIEDDANPGIESHEAAH
jgi:hypothetical protein